jgi:hypothetical protein
VTGLECIPFVCIGRGPNCQPTPVPSPAGRGRVVVARQGRGLIQGFVEVDDPAHAVVGISPRNGLHVTLHLNIIQTHISEFGAHNDTPWANFNKTCAGGDAKWVARFDDGGTLAIEARVTDEDVEMSLLMLALEAFFPDEALEAITCSTVETFFNLVDALNNSEHFNSALAITIHPTDMLDQEKRERAANELVLFLTQDAFEIFEVLAPYVAERAPDALLQFISGGSKRGIDVLIAGIERLRGEYLTYQSEGPDRVEFALQQ